MIIGFCGEMKSGKDTAGAHLIKQYGFQRRAFADKLKQSVGELLRIQNWEIEQYKNDPTVFVTIGHKNTPELPDGVVGPDHMWSPVSEFTFREFLQRYGTESHRGLWPDHWVDACLPRDGFYTDKDIVITDCRFQNEIDRVNQLGGIVCRIKRPSTVEGFDEEKLHSSEQSVLLNDVAYEIMNNTSIEDFYAEIDLMMARLYERTGESI